jgi:hypothetical protein
MIHFQRFFPCSIQWVQFSRGQGPSDSATGQHAQRSSGFAEGLLPNQVQWSDDNQGQDEPADVRLPGRSLVWTTMKDHESFRVYKQESRVLTLYSNMMHRDREPLGKGHRACRCQLLGEKAMVPTQWTGCPSRHSHRRKLA